MHKLKTHKLYVHNKNAIGFKNVLDQQVLKCYIQNMKSVAKCAK